MRAALLLILLAMSDCSGADLLNDTIRTGDLRIEHSVPYTSGPRGGLDIYRPREAGASLPIVVFLYGGSWRYGDKDMYPFVAAPLARRGMVVMVPNYRLYPEVLFPGFVQDNAKAVAWAMAHATDYGGDPRQVFVVGHSAGAYDAAMLALDPRWLQEAGTARGKLAGVVGIAGPYNFLPITETDIIPVFASVDDGPVSQPITYVDGHNPPMLLVAGTADTTVNPQNTVSLAARIDGAGGPVQSKLYPDIGHIGIITAFAPLFRGNAPVLEDVVAFIKAHRPIG